MSRIKILIVEDDWDFYSLISLTLKSEADFEIAGYCADKAEALKKAIETEPDIVLMDLNLNGDAQAGILAAREIRIHTDAKVIILTVYDEPDLIIQASRESFSSAYVLKSQFSMLISTIRHTFHGTTPHSWMIYNSILSILSPAERSVFYWMMGMNKEDLHSSTKTVANQQTSVLHKLKLSSRKEVEHVFRAYYPEIGEENL